MLSQKAKYALKAMLLLAQEPRHALVSTADLAERGAIPKKFLELILLELKRSGFVISQRGPTGGYRLARVPADITFGQIIRLMDGPLAAIPCASISAYRKCADCRNEQTCAIRQAMLAVRDSVAAILDGTTLASACEDESHAVALLRRSAS